MKLKILLVSVFLICSLLLGISHAQNKVVVIPLVEDAPTLEPFAPVTADSPPDTAYTDNSDGTVIDTVTGLVWQKTDDNVTRTWEDAWDYCTQNTHPLPGTGWRLPSDDELMSIVDYGSTSSPAINSVAFPSTNPSGYWSATTYAPSSDYAWRVLFGDGYFGGSNKSGTFYVRCVR